jgi:hypothetical protein
MNTSENLFDLPLAMRMRIDRELNAGEEVEWVSRPNANRFIAREMFPLLFFYASFVNFMGLHVV